MTAAGKKILFEGALTIDHVRQLHTDLKNALAATRHLDIDLSGAIQVDLTFLQLLCSAHRTAIACGKTLELTGNRPEALIRALADNGFAKQNGCENDAGQSCLWRTSHSAGYPDTRREI